MNSIKNIIKTSILEAARYKREQNYTKPSWKEEIGSYESAGGYFVHFSNVPKVGLYLINEFETPIGFYTYPLDYKKMRNFAVERPYAIIVKPKENSNFLYLKNYTEEQFDIDLNKLKAKFDITDEEEDEWISTAKFKNHAGYIWNITRNLSFRGPSGLREAYHAPDPSNPPEQKKELPQDILYKNLDHKHKILNSYRPIPLSKKGGGHTGRWSIILNKILGYQGVIDDCTKIIHTSEPCQAVFFDTTSIEIIDIIKKPMEVNNIKDFQINYTGSNLFDKDFSHRKFDSVSFNSAKLSNTNFSNCMLSRSSFANSTILDCNFKESDMYSAEFSNTQIVSSYFKDSKLSNSYFARAKIKNCYFKNALLNQSVLDNAEIKNCDFTGADLTGIRINKNSPVIFEKCNFSMVKFKDTHFDGVDFANTSFNGAEFDIAYLRNGNYSSSTFQNATFDTSIIGFCNFTDTDFSNAKLVNGLFNGLNFTNSNLSNVDFRESYLKNCNFTNANFTGTKFEGAQYNEATLFPDGFNPEEHGLTIVK